MTNTLDQDLERIHRGLTETEKADFQDSVILITGCAGFLGRIVSAYFSRYRDELGVRRVLGVDTRARKEAGDLSPSLEYHRLDIVEDSLEAISDSRQVTHVLHIASIASPVFYRLHPLETLGANVWGLKNLLDYYRDGFLRGFLYFSSSEIYGEPPPEWIPTPESYRGNVPTTGPRSCYDESKRFGETLCYYYRQEYRMPLAVVRPFNTFGPGMSPEDGRVTADFGRSILTGRDLVLYSDGTPTRTFCYISDAITGYLKALAHCSTGRLPIWNIGSAEPEVSMEKLAGIFLETGRRHFGYSGRIRREISGDPQYLTDNPSRRCPDLTLAERELGYHPRISLEEGIFYYLTHLKEEMDMTHGK